MTKINVYIISKCCIACLAITVAFSSCKKYLDAKSDAKLSTPSTLEDLQAILDNDFVINVGTYALNESTDEYYVESATWNTLAENSRLNYLWKYAPETDNTTDWTPLYNAVFQANTVLDNLDKIPAKAQEEKWNTIKGSALFLRSYYLNLIAQIYAPQYDAATASTDAGIPLRLSSNFNIPSTRASVAATYERIIKDAEEAASLLPASAGFKTRPGKPAAYALLARVYLQMGNYEKAGENAGACLTLFSTLLNYNSVPNVANPFTQLNEEVIFHASSMAINGFDFWTKTDSVNYKTYDNNDLRKQLFFEPSPDGKGQIYTGSYNGQYVLFNGLATDEVHLIRAEAYARGGNVSSAMSDLNTLLIKRWKTGTFIPLTAANASEALSLILTERKKELLNRGTRWSDLKRLNKEPQYAETLKRVINGETTTLPPNDLRYSLLIPQNIIQLTGMQQNPR